MKRITKLLALAATATAMSFGASTVWANLMTLEGITGCASGGTPAGNPGPQRDFCVNPTNNLFDDTSTYDPAGGDGDAAGNFVKNYYFEAGANKGKIAFSVTASFSTDDMFTLTFKNNTPNPQALADNMVMFFGHLQFDDGYLLGFEDSKLTVGGVELQLEDADGNVTMTNEDLVNQMFDAKPLVGYNDTDLNWFKLDFNNDALDVPKNQTVILTSRMVKGVPEPGSLALLGAVLVAFGVMQIRRRAKN